MKNFLSLFIIVLLVIGVSIAVWFFDRPQVPPVEEPSGPLPASPATSTVATTTPVKWGHEMGTGTIRL